ncbi:MAG: 50S ribosomal protein L15 [Chloroflexi bacterium]|jgi:large subunit ribosomal protein L15|nr:50S ribosomal protein L15 [Chloroflexota bacterium]
MKLHDLRPAEGSTKKRKRVGRGISAGQGKSAGRGTKGQGARAGGGKGAYFEGGQLPLVRRLPFKRGFTNIFRTEYQEVNIDDLARVFSAGDEVTPETLAAKGLIRKADNPVVVLGRGELAAALTVKAHRFSKSAQEKITAAGGSHETLELLLTGPLATVKKLRKEQVEKLREQRAAE